MRFRGMPAGCCRAGWRDRIRTTRAPVDGRFLVRLRDWQPRRATILLLDDPRPSDARSVVEALDARQDSYRVPVRLVIVDQAVPLELTIADASGAETRYLSGFHGSFIALGAAARLTAFDIRRMAAGLEVGPSVWRVAGRPGTEAQVEHFLRQTRGNALLAERRDDGRLPPVRPELIGDSFVRFVLRRHCDDDDQRALVAATAWRLSARGTLRTALGVSRRADPQAQPAPAERGLLAGTSAIDGLPRPAGSLVIAVAPGSRQQNRNARDELRCRPDRCRRVLRGNDRIGTDRIVRHRFQVVRIGEKAPQGDVDRGFLTRQQTEPAAHTLMRLWRSAGSLEDERLRRVEAGKIACPPGLVRQRDAQHCLRLRQFLAGLGEMLSGFRRHRSTPSRRISCISGVRSRHAPARKGNGWMTAPVSSMMSVTAGTMRRTSSRRSAKSFRKIATS